MPRRKVWDKLKLIREAEDGGRFYEGRHGSYLFLFGNEPGNRVGRVILNRKFLTGLYRSRFSTKVQRFIGDHRRERKFLFFDGTGKDEITIYWTPKKK